jgi:magnesium transporter
MSSSGGLLPPSACGCSVVGVYEPVLPRLPHSTRWQAQRGQIHLGRRAAPCENPDMIVDCAVYEEGVRRPGELALTDAYEAGRNANSFVWIGLYEPTEQEFESVRQEFNLHRLAVEDAICAHQRPKLEIYGDSLFVVLKPAKYDEESEQIELGELMMFIGDGFVVTVRHGEVRELSEVRHALETKPELLRCGTGAVLHAVIDQVVDDFGPVLMALESDIEEVEAQVFSSSRENPAERIYKLKREVLELHGAMESLVDSVDRLSMGHIPMIHEELPHYFRDVHDHLVKGVEHVNTFRDLLTSVLEANLTQVSVRQNEDMRKISAWVAIAAVPTMIAGIYGMNFEYMPELEWTFGYPLIIFVIVGICAVMYRAFKRNRWL